MKNSRLIYYVWVLLFFIPQIGIAQTLTQANSQIIDVQAESIPTVNNQQVLKNYLQLDSKFGFRSKYDNGKVVRYQLQYGDYDVSSLQVITHGNNETLNRLITPNLENINIVENEVVISQQEAIQILAERVAEDEPLLEEGSEPHVHTVYFSANPKLQGDFELCYEIYMMTAAEPFQYLAYVQVTTGEILSIKESFHNCTSNGTASTVWNGQQNIVTCDVGNGNDFILHDCTRGGGIRTRNLGNQTNFNNFTEFHDDDNNWTPTASVDQHALDAHWGTEFTYDFCDTNLGFDVTAGDELVNGLSASLLQYNNAGYFPAHNRVIYGQSVNNNTVQGYMTALDIVAHELGHAVTHHNSNLAYAGESGALNESFSDILGMIVQAAGGDYNWTMGENLSAIRSLQNPNAYEDPDTYLGDFWYAGSSNSTYVHTNSGVGNHWFYLLTEGGAGVNDNGDSFSVMGIGLGSASAIAFEVWMNYLGANSNYFDFENAAIASAIDLFGECSQEHISTTNALHAVGLGAPFNALDPITQLVADPVTNCSAFLSWEDNGASTYSLLYREVGTSNWIQIDGIRINEFILSDLDPNTTYEWQVTNACVDPGAPVFISQFTTTNLCPAVDPITIVELSACSASLDWDNYGAASYDVSYAVAGTSNFTTVTTNTSDILLDDLDAGTEYVVFIVTNCSDDCQSLASATIEFETDKCEPNNTGSIYNISACRATFIFDPVPGESYRVRIPTGPGSSTIRNLDPGENHVSIARFGNQPTVTFILETICTGPGCILYVQADPVVGTYPAPDPSNTCSEPTNVIADVMLVGTDYYFTVDFDQSGAYDYHQVRYKSSTGTFWWDDDVFVTPQTLKMPFGILCMDVEVRTICTCDAPGLASDWIPISAPLCLPCDPPMDMSVSDLCSESVNLSFDLPQAASGMEGRYRPLGNSQWTDDFSMGNLNPNVDLTDLIPGTTYEVEVRSRCGNNPTVYSDWVTFTFTTPDVCQVPTGLSAIVIDETTAEITWDIVPGATSYDFSYCEDGTNNCTTINVTTNSYTLSGVDLTQGYWLKVKSICTICDESDWSSEIFIQFDEECEVDESLVSVVVTENSAVVTPAGGAQAFFKVRHRVAGTTTWSTSTNINATDFEILSLLSCTDYEFQVRIRCAPGDWSAWSNTMTFTTLCPCDLDLSSLFSDPDYSYIYVYPFGGFPEDFNYRWRELGTTTWTTGTETNSNNIFANGLDDCTDYEFQVQLICPGGALSDWSTSIIVTTLCCEIDISNLTSDPDYRYIYVYPFGTANGDFNYRYRKVGTTTWTTGTKYNSNHIYASALKCCTDYEFQVQMICGGGTTSDWSTSVIVTTLCCEEDFSNLTMEVFENLVYIHPFGGQSGVFQIIWREVGTSGWNNNGVTNGYYDEITGLSPCTQYEFRIRKRCVPGCWSSWTSPISFETECCDAPTTPTYVYYCNSNIIYTRSSALQGIVHQNRYRFTGSDNPWTTLEPITNYEQELTEIPECVGIEFQVRQECGSGGNTYWSPWSESRIFEGIADELPAGQVTVSGEGTSTIEICVDNNMEGSVDLEWEINPSNAPYINSINVSPNSVQCISITVEVGDKLCYRYQRYSPHCDNPSCWNYRCLEITEVDEEKECDGCDVIYMKDNSSGDEEENANNECRIKEDSEDISEDCPDCESEFAVTSFGGEEQEDSVIPFDCEPVTDFEKDAKPSGNNPSRSVGDALWNLQNQLTNGELGETDAECLKVKIYTSATCEELTAPIDIGDGQISLQQMINILSASHGVQVCIMHTPTYDEAGNQTNSLAECEGLGEIPVMPVEPDCEEGMFNQNNINAGTETTITSFKEEVSVYPNPFDQMVSFEINLIEASSVSLEVFNAVGEKVIHRFVSDVDKGLHKMTINEELSSGAYYYLITVDGQTHSGKLIKM